MGDLFLIRHGQSAHNADGIIQGPRVDGPLSAVGEFQATALAEALAATGLDAVFSSPLMRARATADAVANAQGNRQPTRIVPEMYEMDFGALCGLRRADVEEEIEQVVDAWSMGFINEPFPDGESPVITQHRIRRFARQLGDICATRSVAMVAHGRVNRVLAATLMERSLTKLHEIPQDNANITKLSLEDGRVIASEINDVSHLDSLDN